MRAIAGRIIRDGEALEALMPAWWDLWRRCPAATPFQSPAWLVPWWRHFAPGELVTMVVERDDALVGLAPFYREDGPWGRRLLPLGIPISDYHDVLLAPEEAIAAWDVVLELARQEPGWDLWEFEELMPGAAALGLPCPPGWERTTGPQSACPTSSFSLRGFVDSLPRARRQKLNLARNRAARRSCVEVRLADAASLRESLDHLFRLHAMRWESRGESGVLSDEPIRRFHGAAAPALERAGLLRLTTLAIDGVVVAAQYGFQHRERAYHYLGGFDPAYAFESPGVLLLAHAIEDALRDGVREFHFLRGQEAYKYDWGAVDRWNQRLSFRRSGAQHGVK
jgi:CelD/BcsL family acetyltransferase involved in cellulose biosynthesis